MINFDDVYPLKPLPTSSGDDVQIKKDDTPSTVFKNNRLPKLDIPKRQLKAVESEEMTTLPQTPLTLAPLKQHCLKNEKSSCDCRVRVKNLEYQLEYLRLELESQRELSEYHSQRAHQAELVNAFLKRYINRNSKMQLNSLTVEYGKITSLENPLATPKLMVSFCKLARSQEAPDWSSKPRKCSIVNAKSIRK